MCHCHGNDERLQANRIRAAEDDRLEPAAGSTINEQIEVSIGRKKEKVNKVGSFL